MHCTETSDTTQQRRALLGALGALAALAAGCASKAPAPAPAPAPAAPAPAAARPAPAPAPVAPPPPPPPPPSVAVSPKNAPDLGPRVALPAPAVSRTMDEFKRNAGRRMVAGSPKFSYLGKPPPMNFAIVIVETEVNADGSVKSVMVTRPPANIDAADTADIAMEAIRRAGPYGDMSRLPKPWKWSEVFLFNDKRQFKPRSLE